MEQAVKSQSYLKELSTLALSIGGTKTTVTRFWVNIAS